MLDVRDVELQQDEQEIIAHPAVGGVILFSRNYESPEQLRVLCNAIRKAKNGDILISVDQEGGRVQRFHHGFTKLPANQRIGMAYEKDQDYASNISHTAGWLMAAELLSVGIDFSFAPVLDLYNGNSHVIGDRAFHSDPNIITELAKKYIQGMNQAGMHSVSKHFPGHGSVVEDSHIALPCDNRDLNTIHKHDLISFKNIIQSCDTAIMPAHIIFSKIDPNPACFSNIWLNHILRQELQFTHAIFSDDLSMAGAEIAGNYLDRVNTALKAGCDMVLICNQQAEAINVLQDLDYQQSDTSSERLRQMSAKPRLKNTFKELKESKQWQHANGLIKEFTAQYT